MSTAVMGQGTPDRHYVYPPTGRKLVPVTTILDATDAKQHVLVPWSARLAAEYCADNIAVIQALLASGEDGRQQAINLIKAQTERRRNLKRDAGTYIHDVVEALVLWGATAEAAPEIALPSLPEELMGADYDDEPIEAVVDAMVEGFLSFCADFGPEFEATEMTVYSPALGIAGTLDLIIRLRGVKLGPRGRLIPAPGNVLTLCVDIKTGRVQVTWREQVAAYRRMTEARMPMGDLVPMPATDHAAVLHLHPRHRRGYRLMIVPGRADAAAWNRFRRAADIYHGRHGESAKPGKVSYPLRPDGTMQPPDLADLDGEGYGRVLGWLIKAGYEHLEEVAALTAAQCLAVKGIGAKTIDTVRAMLADNGLCLAGEKEHEQGRAA